MITEAMKRARLSDAPRDIVRLNVGGKLFHTSRETLSRSGFFTSLLDFAGGDSEDADGHIFVDRSGRLFGVLLESWRTSRRPPQIMINSWKAQLLEECKYFVAEEVAKQILGRTCDADLCPACRRIALEERERIFVVENVFQAPLVRKDVAQLQLPPLMLAPQLREDPVLFGSFYDCKASLNVQTGGLLLALEQDPLISKFVVIAGGAAAAALTGCDAGAPAHLVFVVCLCCAVAVKRACRSDALPSHLLSFSRNLRFCRHLQATPISF